MEADFYRRLPSGATLHTGRMYMEETTPEGESIMLDRYTMPAARDVGTVNPEVVVFGCTSAGALRGSDYDRELCERIGHATGPHVVSVIASVRRAILGQSVRRVGVITPYVESLNERIRASLEEDGLEVVAIHGLGISENFAIAGVEPRDIAAFAEDRLGALDVDLVFVSCTNFRAVDAIPLIQELLGRPVVTSNQAALEATLAAIEELAAGSGAKPTAEA